MLHSPPHRRFDRTYEGLKRPKEGAYPPSQDSFDRTYEGLKPLEPLDTEERRAMF